MNSFYFAFKALKSSRVGNIQQKDIKKKKENKIIFN